MRLASSGSNISSISNELQLHNPIEIGSKSWPCTSASDSIFPLTIHTLDLGSSCLEHPFLSRISNLATDHRTQVEECQPVIVLANNILLLVPQSPSPETAALLVEKLHPDWPNRFFFIPLCSASQTAIGERASLNSPFPDLPQSPFCSPGVR